MPSLIKVTGGSLFLYSPGGFAFLLRTSAFSARINLSDSGSFPLPCFCAPGSQCNPSGTLAGDQTLNSGPVDFAGQMYPQLWFTGVLTFTATPFVVPATTPTKAIVKNTAFTLAGSLNAFPSNPTTGDPLPLFQYQLQGKGKVTTRLTPIIAGASRDVTSYFYSFT